MSEAGNVFGTGMDGITLGAWALAAISLYVLWSCMMACLEARRAQDSYGWLVVSFFGILVLLEFSLGVALEGTLSQQALQLVLQRVWIGGLLIVSGLLGLLRFRQRPGEWQVGLYLSVFAVFATAFGAFVWSRLL